MWIGVIWFGDFLGLLMLVGLAVWIGWVCCFRVSGLGFGGLVVVLDLVMPLLVVSMLVVAGFGNLSA